VKALLLSFVVACSSAASPEPSGEPESQTPPATAENRIAGEPTCKAMCQRAEACPAPAHDECGRSCATVLGYCPQEMLAFIRCAQTVEMICKDGHATTLGCTAEARAVDACIER
jgi:hypothetical protein